MLSFPRGPGRAPPARFNSVSLLVVLRWGQEAKSSSWLCSPAGHWPGSGQQSAVSPRFPALCCGRGGSQRLMLGEGRHPSAARGAEVIASPRAGRLQLGSGQTKSEHNRPMLLKHSLWEEFILQTRSGPSPAERLSPAAFSCSSTWAGDGTVTGAAGVSHTPSSSSPGGSWHASSLPTVAVR